jgi:hypothetical protein
MLATWTLELLVRLQNGTFDPTEVATLEQTAKSDWLADLSSEYPHVFQERQLRHKWEVGRARLVQHRATLRSYRRSLFPVLVLVPAFRDCLLVSGEGDAVTGIAAITRLTMKQITKPTKGLAISTGQGFKLDKSLDGWGIKPIAKRTVELTEDLLRKRGWRFDSPWHVS